MKIGDPNTGVFRVEGLRCTPELRGTTGQGIAKLSTSKTWSTLGGESLGAT